MAKNIAIKALAKNIKLVDNGTTEEVMIKVYPEAFILDYDKNFEVPVEIVGEPDKQKWQAILRSGKLSDYIEVVETADHRQVEGELNLWSDVNNKGISFFALLVITVSSLLVYWGERRQENR